MSKIEQKFIELEKKNEKALIPFITLGDPSPEFSLKIVRTLVDSGADIIELGIPFSDPIADGPTIQASSMRSLANGMTPDLAFNLVKEIRGFTNIPLVFLTYYNIVFQRGVNRFFHDCSECGIDGVIIPDLPVEEAALALEASRKTNVDLIFIVTPATSESRLSKILQVARGFVYVVSLFGVTGARKKLSEITLETLKKIKPYTKGKIPVSVGFGISKPEHVKELILAGADGAIVGSAIIDILAKNLKHEKVVIEKIGKYVQIMKEMTILHW